MIDVNNKKATPFSHTGDSYHWFFQTSPDRKINRVMDYNEAFVHEFFGHAYDYTIGRYSDKSISYRETNAVGITNYYRSQRGIPIRTLYYYKRERIHLTSPGAWQPWWRKFW